MAGVTALWFRWTVYRHGKLFSLDVAISWVVRGARRHCQLAFSWCGAVRTDPDPWSLSPCPLHPHSSWNRMEVMGTLPRPRPWAPQAATAVQVSARPVPRGCHNPAVRWALGCCCPGTFGFGPAMREAAPGPLRFIAARHSQNSAVATLRARLRARNEERGARASPPALCRQDGAQPLRLL